MSKLAWLSVLACAAALHAETGYDAWLRYAPLEGAALDQYRQAVPAVVSLLDASPVAMSAQAEIVRGIKGMLGRTLREESSIPRENAIVIGMAGEVRGLLPAIDLAPDAFWLRGVTRGQLHFLVMTASNDRGLLYGAFALLRKIAMGESLENLDQRETPRAPARWVDQWDRLNGTIERGYGGNSIFWENDHARHDLTRASDYARLLASIGINACSINDVNADPRLLTPEYAPEIARIAGAMRPWGVRTAISVDFGSPQTVGKLDTFDPLDQKVAAWWKARIDALYAAVPDLAGIVLKADSEGRVGPSAYHRTHADAANVVARALAPHGGLLFYRGFVYDHHMDWNNPKNDRARAAYDNFHGLDGQFDANVIIQIKNGPIDFQVREPASPLFAGLEKTSEAIELQVTQEYFGQAKHTVFLVPCWKETLDFQMGHAAVKALVHGFVGVVNAGLDENWFGNHLSQANLYGFGRLAWNPDLTSQKIAGEWTRQAFGPNPKVDQTVAQILLTSWRTYENYTGPLGLQTLTDITGNHYGVNVEASERNGWGQWHRADEHGVGMDRTVATGTGYIGQYPKAEAERFESLATCPDDLLLFFHHVPYTYKLHSGKTVIQYIYDSHYEGADEVARYVEEWKSLRGLIDDERYQAVLAQLGYQAGQAVVWRDAVTTWFYRESQIPDARGRVDHYPGRVEAESMTLTGYTIRDISTPSPGRGNGRPVVTPAEDASGGKVVACPAGTASCTAATKFTGLPGWYKLHVEYFDQANGASQYRVFVNAQLVDEWHADLRLPSVRLDSTTSTRRTIAGIALRPGDEIRIEGTPDGGEAAALDYLEVVGQ
ncbi:MAG TPA: alpha-glucuronidase family glycosyl hydrolase [Bryobacteraceae bacterium]|nr:alpha-glucuronidase family glycosyl hydrolase [Bryobacteraceae bacterium]